MLKFRITSAVSTAQNSSSAYVKPLYDCIGPGGRQGRRKRPGLVILCAGAACLAEMRYAEGKLNSIGHQGFQEEVIVHERSRGTIECKLSTKSRVIY